MPTSLIVQRLEHSLDSIGQDGRLVFPLRGGERPSPPTFLLAASTLQIQVRFVLILVIAAVVVNMFAERRSSVGRRPFFSGREIDVSFDFFLVLGPDIL